MAMGGGVATGTAARCVTVAVTAIVGMRVVTDVAFSHIELAGLAIDVVVSCSHRRTLLQLLSSRSTAAVASVNLRSASGPPAVTASARQWRR